LYKALVKEIHRVPDRVRRLAIANDIAEYVGLEAGMVLDEFRRAAGERRAPRSALREQKRMDANELLLLHALLSNAEAREMVAPTLRQVESARKWASWPVFEAALKMAEAGEEVSFRSLDPRLNEPERHLLQTAFLADEFVGTSVSVEQAVACLDKLVALDSAARIHGLREQVKEAERAGNWEEALRLSEELSREQALRRRRVESSH
jgi:hypothetical protein